VTIHETGGSPPEDEATNIRAAQRDPAAFSPLYERYSGPIYRYCFRQSKDIDIASDLTAQVFMQALEKIGSYGPRPGATFRSWLFAIAGNIIRDRWRRHTEVPVFDSASYLLVEHGPGPEEIAVHRAEMAWLLDVLDKLPDRQRHIVEMRL
jgi:RNA polymerase sigma-70 factor (ECF subfamily)